MALAGGEVHFMFLSVLTSTPLIKADLAKWEVVIKSAGARMD